MSIAPEEENKQLWAQLRSVGAELKAARAENEPLWAQLRSVGAELEAARDEIRGLRRAANPEAEAPGLPSILFNALPKSASTYWFEALRRASGLDRAPELTVAMFPTDTLIWRHYVSFAKGGWIAHHHVPACGENLWFLREHPVRLIVQVRDPRQAILSWLHHLLRQPTRRVPVLNVNEPPLSWFDWKLPEQIDWIIAHNFSLFVRWLQQWGDAIDAGKVTCLLTRFEDMACDPTAFAVQLARYCGVDEAAMMRSLPERTEATLFRKGLVDEWREVFSSEQKRRVAELVPSSLLRRFGWSD